MDGIHSGRVSGSRRPSLLGLYPNNNDCRAASQTSVKKQAVKRHHHKHNLKHRYEFLETLGKGTYGKVKKARERSGRLVSRSALTAHLYRVVPHNSGAARGVSSATCCVDKSANFIRLFSGNLLEIRLFILGKYSGGFGGSW